MDTLTNIDKLSSHTTELPSFAELSSGLVAHNDVDYIALDLPLSVGVSSYGQHGRGSGMSFAEESVVLSSHTKLPVSVVDEGMLIPIVSSAQESVSTAFSYGVKNSAMTPFNGLNDAYDASVPSKVKGVAKLDVLKGTGLVESVKFSGAKLDKSGSVSAQLAKLADNDNVDVSAKKDELSPTGEYPSLCALHDGWGVAGDDQMHQSEGYGADSLMESPQGQDLGVSSLMLQDSPDLLPQQTWSSVAGTENLLVTWQSAIQVDGSERSSGYTADIFFEQISDFAGIQEGVAPTAVHDTEHSFGHNWFDRLIASTTDTEVRKSTTVKSESVTEPAGHGLSEPDPGMLQDMPMQPDQTVIDAEKVSMLAGMGLVTSFTGSAATLLIDGVLAMPESTVDLSGLVMQEQALLSLADSGMGDLFASDVDGMASYATSAMWEVDEYLEVALLQAASLSI